MPELPEVEGIRDVLSRHLIGLSVVSVNVVRDDVIKSMKGSVHVPGRSEWKRSLLVGGTLNDVLRHGKRLALILDDERVLEFGLGMSGELRFIPEGDEWDQQPHEHVSWVLKSPQPRNGGSLIWKDPRRFGGITPVGSLKTLKEHQWAPLGPDALEISREAFLHRLGAGRGPIKTRLLNQQVVAGIGNIYADEALFDSGIHPSRASNRISAKRLEGLRRSVQRILHEAIRAGGSSIRSYRDPDGRGGSFQNAHAIYGRQNEPCIRCATPIRSKQLGGRTTVWCPRCQR